MSPDDDFEKLIDDLGECLRQARGLKLQHAVYLLNMAIMEVADRSIGHPGAPSASAPGRARPAFRYEI
jgi:hypothetical protein